MLRKLKIFNRSYLKEKRRSLRNNGTAAEATLWLLLQRSQLQGRKFRRQHSIGNYIADFYCPSEKIVVELDGQSHFTASGAAADYERDRYFNSLGIKVIRFENKEVFQNAEAVLAQISALFSNSDSTG